MMIVAQVEHLECSERRPPPACLLSVIHSFLDFQLFLSFHCRGIFSFFQLLILRARIGMKRTGKWWRRREWNKRTKKWTETEEKSSSKRKTRNTAKCLQLSSSDLYLCLGRARNRIEAGSFDVSTATSIDSAVGSKRNRWTNCAASKTRGEWTL